MFFTLGILHSCGQPCRSQPLRQDILSAKPFTIVQEIVLFPDEDQKRTENIYGKFGKVLSVFWGLHRN